MVIAGAGTPIQAVALGLLWVGAFTVLAVWPRAMPKRSRRFHRWNREGIGPWAGWPPEQDTKPWEPAERIVKLYRLVSLAMVALGLVLVAGAVRRM